MRSESAEAIFADRHHGDAQGPLCEPVSGIEGFSAFVPILDDIKYEAKVDDVCRPPKTVWRVVRIPAMRLEAIGS